MGGTPMPRCHATVRNMGGPPMARATSVLEAPMRRAPLLLILLAFSFAAYADPPATQPGDGKMPHLQVDVKRKQVRVECESCNANQDVGLEFFCVAAGTNEYEAVLSSKVKASHLHLALLMIGLEPGEPV